MTASLTVVIPALDEERRLGALLDCLERQTVPPDAVVVADAGSTDRTRDVARAAGALVVEGGRPGAGRNAGAAVADTDLLLFLDADVEIEPDAVERMLAEFAERDLAAASAHLLPTEEDPGYALACEVVNFYLEVMQYVSPHAPGACILAERAVHEAIGGFDEALALAEDHDYVRRAAEIGRFRILRDAYVRTSMRRLDKEGLVQLAFKYLYCELHVVTGQRLTEVPFDYEFAAFAPADRAESVDAVEALRQRLEELAGTLAALSSEGREAIRRLGAEALDPGLAVQLLDRIRTEDVRALERYLRVRVRLARRGSRRALARVRRAADAIARELARAAG